MQCVRCHHELRDGASFCSACGERQPVVVETPEAVARYREMLAKLIGSPDTAATTQLETLRNQLGVSLATHARLAGELDAVSPPPPSIKLAIDVATLSHLAVGARGLVRFRIENEGRLALDTLAVRATWSGAALPIAEAATLFPGRAAIVAIHVEPAQAGFHELAGELRVRDLMGEDSTYRFADVHVRAASDAAQVNVITIDQSAARVVDNSRSSFGTPAGGGLVGDGDWQPIALQLVRAPAQKATTNARRVEFAITTETATYQVTTTLANGDIATVYGGHVRGSGQPVALKIADQTSDNDLMQHESRVLKLLFEADGEGGKSKVHLAQPRDQFRTTDGRLGSVFDHLDGFDLTAVRDRCRKRGEVGLPANHVVWVLRRSLAALGWAHKQGILHGNLDPAHILVRPHDHNVWLIDWCWAVVNPAQTGQGFKALNETYSPPEVKERGKPTPASDLYALGKCAIHLLGGDPASKTLPDMDPKLARFIKYLCVESQGGRPQDAWELYSQLSRLREQIWGKHSFVPLEL